MMSRKKRVLITNDDGYDSKGLLSLVDAIKEIADVTVIAPSSEKSACGHSLTLTRPLRFIKIDDNFYKLDDGTPSDCIYLGVTTLFDNRMKPDLIISGINVGANMGEDITYSGTASAAMEGVLLDIPSIAISQVCQDKCHNIDDLEYKLAKKIIKDIVYKILNSKFPLGERKFLNINIPPITIDECNGIKITKAGYRLYDSNASVHTNPRGIEYHWLGLHPLKWKSSSDNKISCDFDAIEQNYISISPIKLDMSAYDEIKNLENFFNE